MYVYVKCYGVYADFMGFYGVLTFSLNLHVETNVQMISDEDSAVPLVTADKDSKVEVEPYDTEASEKGQKHPPPTLCPPCFMHEMYQKPRALTILSFSKADLDIHMLSRSRQPNDLDLFCFSGTCDIPCQMNDSLCSVSFMCTQSPLNCLP